MAPPTPARSGRLLRAPCAGCTRHHQGGRGGAAKACATGWAGAGRGAECLRESACWERRADQVPRATNAKRTTSTQTSTMTRERLHPGGSEPVPRERGSGLQLPSGWRREGRRRGHSPGAPREEGRIPGNSQPCALPGQGVAPWCERAPRCLLCAVVGPCGCPCCTGGCLRLGASQGRHGKEWRYLGRARAI